MNDKDYEIWKFVRGYEKSYQVSNFGRIKSLNKKVKNKNGYRKKIGKILKPTLYHGYEKVCLIRKLTFVHRVVADNFLIKPTGKNIVVNHKNGIKTDNRVENLEWCTQSQNVKHSYANGLQKPTISKMKKLDDLQVLTILTVKKQRLIARYYNVTQSVIQKILYGETYKTITKGLL